MTNVLGDKIRKLRKGKELTLEGLAEKTDSSKSYIWELENKNPPRPSADKITRIAKVLGVTSDFLMDETDLAPEQDVLDNAFFRKYRKMDKPTKLKIRTLIDMWDKEE